MHENGSEMKSPVEFEQMLKKIWRKQHRVQMEEEGKEGSEGLKRSTQIVSVSGK